MDCSLPGSSVHGILQERMLEWVAIPFPGDLPNPHDLPEPCLLHCRQILYHWGKAHDIPCMWNLKINDTKELTK